MRGWIVAAWFLAGCGGMRTVVLPTPAAGHGDTLQEVEACAQQEGRQYFSGGLNPTVQGDRARVQFMRMGATTNLAVLPEAGLGADARDGVVVEAIALGRRLWSCAEGRAAGTTPAPPGRAELGLLAPVEQEVSLDDEEEPEETAPRPALAPDPEPDPAPEAAPVQLGPCERLIACNVALAEAFCEGMDTCDFEIEVSGNDPSQCERAMSSVDDVIRVARMLNPRASKPPECS